MNTDLRHELMDTLTELSRQYPEMRFGQLVLFVARLARGAGTSAMYDIEDEELLAAAKSALGEAAASTRS
jgi:hypothetical protein